VSDLPFVIEEPVTRRELNRRYAAWVLERTKGSKSRAAKLLGIDRASLRRQLLKAA